MGNTSGIIDKMFKKRGGDDAFPVVIDYGLSLGIMIMHGKYDRTSYDITHEFSIQGRGKVKVSLELIHFGRSMSGKAVLRELETRGLRAAIIEELLAFGAAYLGRQRRFSIVALGSLWMRESGARAPYLCEHNSERHLTTGLFDDWPACCRFLAVRKTA